MMRPAVPTPIYRLLHIDNLAVLLERGALHAPNATPNDGLAWRPIHNTAVQASRQVHRLPYGPGGTIHDYVPFYFGPLSVMLLNLKTGRVPGYDQGQEPLIYLVASAQVIAQHELRFVFSDGHGLATFTGWYDDLERLDQVDWSLVGERYWADTPEDNDRQRRKQAEFLIWQSLDWSLIGSIGVLNQQAKQRVESILSQHPDRHHPSVVARPNWYYR